MDLIMPQLAIKRGEFLEVQIEYRAGIPYVWNLIFVMAAGEMPVREWIPTQGSVFKETQGCFGLLRAIQSSEVAGMSRVCLRTHPNNPRKSLQAANCSRNLPVVHYRHILPHTSSQLHAELSSVLSAHVSSQDWWLLLALRTQNCLHQAPAHKGRCLSHCLGWFLFHLKGKQPHKVWLAPATGQSCHGLTPVCQEPSTDFHELPEALSAKHSHPSAGAGTTGN